MAARMEGLMASVVALDASPTNVLRLMRGEIVAARIAFPDVLHIEVRDPHGDLWRFATQDAEWSPSDPAELLGHNIKDVEIESSTGELRCRFSDGGILDVQPARREADDDPPNWELISPTGTVLEFGPGLRWQISAADEPVSARR